MTTWKIVGLERTATGLLLKVEDNQNLTGSSYVSPYEWEKIVQHLGTESTFQSMSAVPEDAISDLVSMATRVPLDDEEDI